MRHSEFSALDAVDVSRTIYSNTQGSYGYCNFALIRSKPELHARNQNFFHCCFHRTHVPHHGLCKLNKQCVMGYLKRFNLDIFEQSMFNVT